MKKISIEHAEIIPFYGTTDVVRTNKIDSGTFINFNIKTRVNDRVENSPVIYDECCIFATTEEQCTTVMTYIKEGNIVEINGVEDRSSWIDKKSNQKRYKSRIKVSDITPIQVNETTTDTNSTEDLPF